MLSWHFGSKRELVSSPSGFFLKLFRHSWYFSCQRVDAQVKSHSAADGWCLVFSRGQHEADRVHLRSPRPACCHSLQAPHPVDLTFYLIVFIGAAGGTDETIIMTLRRVNVIILVLLAVAFLIIVQRNLLNLSDFLHKEHTDHGMILPFESELTPDLRLQPVRGGEEVPVLITAVEDRLGAVVAAMNSVYQNSKANVVFTIVTLNDTVSHLKEWLSDERLKHVKYRIAVFKPELLAGKISQDPQILEATKPLTFARFYLPAFIPEAEKAIYLDDDVIVQGDIQELYETSLKPGHAAAFSDDCDSASSKGIIRGAGTQNNYIGFLDFKKEAIKTLGMRATTCSFNPGVIVVNLTEWKNQNITQQLEHWMELNTKEDLYSKTLAESIITPPLLIVFYKRHSILDPMWHVRHLGATGAGNRYSPQFVKAAKLLHWNGHYKPWTRVSSFSDVWDKWFIDDPTGKFHPVRRHSGDS